jgi:hypothetical protein
MADPRIPAEYRADVDAMSPALKQLLRDELDAGNTIASVGHSFPAPPVGAFVMLARAVTTRPRASGESLTYRARNSSLCSGEFTDAHGFYFILEPPGPPPDEPDMDAIRAAANAPRPAQRVHVDASSSPLERFVASMAIDYDKWHDGIGYDLDVLKDCSAGERASIEARLVPPKGWRDVEALASLRELGSQSAEPALRAAMRSSVSEVRLAVLRHAPDLVDDDTRTAALVRAIEAAGSFDGLDATLSQVEEFHPPAVIDALFRGLLTRDGTTACNYAGMLAFLHGKTKEPFDWAMRPLFLEFNTDDRTERERAFRKLCAILGVDPAPFSRGQTR